MRRAQKWHECGSGTYYISFDSKKMLSGNLSKLTSTQFSAFLFCGLKVRPLESGTKQCSFHVHGGQVKSKALLEVEIIFCQFEGSSVDW